MASEQINDLKIAGMTNSLRACQLFAGLSPSDLRNIATIAIPKQLQKGEYLFHERDVSRGFYVVQKGAVNVHRVNSAGKEQVIHVFRAGDSFAEGTLATETGYPADARALESTQVLLVQKIEFISLLRKHPELALRMLGSMSQHLRVLVGLLDDLTLKDVETRLANWLVKRCPDRLSNQPMHVVLPMTKRVLAAELGTVSETLSRTLAKFREQGYLQVKGKTVTIVSPTRLSALLSAHLGE